MNYDTAMLDWLELNHALHEWTISPGIGDLHYVGVAPLPPRHTWRWHRTFRAALWYAYRCEMKPII